MSEPFYFGDPSAPLFGVLDRAPAESAVDRGVVICAPLGYENIIYYRQLGILARRLALAGRSTLRFDWPGCGDSAGDDRQPGLVAAYLASVGSAVDELRAHTGVAAVDLVGLRIGGTLAAAAAAHGADVSDLVLWAPYTSGRAYVRGMRAFDRLSYQEDEEVDPDAPEGQQASGFILAPTTIADLGGVDLTKLEYGSPRRFLLAGRDEPPDEALVSHLRGLGHDVSSTVLEGLREVALGWTERPVPDGAFADIGAWLAPAPRKEEHIPDRPPRKAADLAVEGVRLHEETVTLEDGSPMLGVVATPVDSAYDDSWVIFLPNRYARRIGSNRMYTQWARLWATAGVASLRIDVNGTGDAGGPEGETDRDMYRANAVDDVLRAAAFLRENYGARRFAVMGLCSGGYIGFHAALTDSSIEQVILLNPQMLLWTDQETSVTRAKIIRRGALKLSTWQKVFANRGALLKAILPVVGETVKSDLRWRFNRLRGRDPGGAGAQSIRGWIIDSLDRLEARDCRVLFVFSERDPGTLYLARHLGEELTGLADRSNVTIETIHGADHTFRLTGRQIALRETLEAHLTAAGFSVVADVAERGEASATG